MVYESGTFGPGRYLLLGLASVKGSRQGCEWCPCSLGVRAASGAPLVRRRPPVGKVVDQFVVRTSTWQGNLGEQVEGAVSTLASMWSVGNDPVTPRRDASVGTTRRAPARRDEGEMST